MTEPQKPWNPSGSEPHPSDDHAHAASDDAPRSHGDAPASDPDTPTPDPNAVLSDPDAALSEPGAALSDPDAALSEPGPVAPDGDAPDFGDDADTFSDDTAEYRYSSRDLDDDSSASHDADTSRDFGGGGFGGRDADTSRDFGARDADTSRDFSGDGGSGSRDADTSRDFGGDGGGFGGRDADTSRVFDGGGGSGSSDADNFPGESTDDRFGSHHFSDDARYLSRDAGDSADGSIGSRSFGENPGRSDLGEAPRDFDGDADSRDFGRGEAPQDFGHEPDSRYFGGDADSRDFGSEPNSRDFGSDMARDGGGESSDEAGLQDHHIFPEDVAFGGQDSRIIPEDAEILNDERGSGLANGGRGSGLANDERDSDPADDGRGSGPGNDGRGGDLANDGRGGDAGNGGRGSESAGEGAFGGELGDPSDTAVLGALAGGAYDRAADHGYYRPEDDADGGESAGDTYSERTDGLGEPASAAGPGGPATGRARRLTGAGLTIALLLGLLGFTLVVQVKSNSTDAAFASQRETDLLQIMSDLDSAERRLQQDIEALEDAKRDLQSGVAGQTAAQEEAKKRADALGILAGTLEATGPGVEVKIVAGSEPINANDLLSAVQDLRIGDAEAIQINGSEASVRVVASTSFVDADGGIRVDGVRLTGPYTVLAIGQPELLKGALEFAGGVVPRLSRAGGNVIVNIKNPVEIKVIRTVSALQYAEPVS